MVLHSTRVMYNLGVATAKMSKTQFLKLRCCLLLSLFMSVLCLSSVACRESGNYGIDYRGPILPRANTSNTNVNVNHKNGSEPSYEVISAGRLLDVYLSDIDGRHYYQPMYNENQGLFFVGKSAERIAPLVRSFDGRIFRGNRVIALDVSNICNTRVKDLIRNHGKTTRSVLLSAVDRINGDTIKHLGEHLQNKIAINITEYSGRPADISMLKTLSSKVAFLHIGLSRSPHYLEKVKGLSPRERLGSLVKTLKLLPNVLQLSIEASQVSGLDLLPLKDISNRLVSLKLTMKELSHASFHILSRLSSLERLSVTVDSVDQKMLNLLSKLSKLHTLDIYVKGRYFQSESIGKPLDFRAIGSVVTFRVRVEQIKRRTMLALCGLTKIENIRLELDVAKSYTLMELACLNRLRSVAVSSGKRVTISANDIFKNTGIRAISLRNFFLSGIDAVNVSKNRRLKRLTLSNAGLHDADMPFLKNMPQLRKLDISGNKITDAAVQLTKKLRNLQEANYGYTAIGLTGLSELLTHRSLRYLDASFCSGGVSGVTKVPEIKDVKLHYINISGSRIGERYLLSLVVADNMRRINTSRASARSKIIDAVCKRDVRGVVDVCYGRPRMFNKLKPME